MQNYVIFYKEMCKIYNIKSQQMGCLIEAMERQEFPHGKNRFCLFSANDFSRALSSQKSTR